MGIILALLGFILLVSLIFAPSALEAEDVNWFKGIGVILAIIIFIIYIVVFFVI